MHYVPVTRRNRLTPSGLNNHFVLETDKEDPLQLGKKKLEPIGPSLVLGVLRAHFLFCRSCFWRAIS